MLDHRLPGRRSQAMEGVGFAAGYLPLPDRLRVREVLGYFANLHGVADPAPAIEAGPAAMSPDTREPGTTAPRTP